MTYEDFTYKFKKKNSFDKYWKYFISISTIGIGLYLLYLLNFTEWYDLKKVTTKNIMPIWGIQFICGLFISLGLCGFWRIPKIYEFTLIRSELSIDKKKQIINHIINDLKLNEHESNEQYQHLSYQGKFWNRFDVYIFYDTNNFYLNVQQENFRGGYIDFGSSNRLTDKIKNNIQNACGYYQ